jgi:predicted nucleic acid-binding protein
MSFYIDTSVAVAFLTTDVLTPKAIQLLNAQMETDVQGFCSDWVCAEYRCAVAAKHRSGQILAADFWRLSQAVDLMRHQTFLPLPTQPADVVRAGEMAARSPHIPLRAADALHIALASRVGASVFLTFDKAQANAARALLVGVDVIGA